MIDERAIIDPKATLAPDVSVGPWSIIGPDVTVGEGSVIGPHVVIKGPTRIGKGNKIFQFSSIGEDPQDKKYGGEETFLEIGDCNIIREGCTLNRGTRQGGGITKIGSHNLLMAYVHVGHDCIVQDHTVLVNYVGLAGHVTVKNYAILGGYSGVHQYCTVGAYSFLAFGSHIRKDVLPFVMVSGTEATTFGLNAEGLRRNGFSAEKITVLKQAYKIIFKEGLTVDEAIEQLQTLKSECSEVNLFIEGLQESTRGIVR